MKQYEVEDAIREAILDEKIVELYEFTIECSHDEHGRFLRICDSLGDTIVFTYHEFDAGLMERVGSFASVLLDHMPSLLLRGSTSKSEE